MAMRYEEVQLHKPERGQISLKSKIGLAQYFSRNILRIEQEGTYPRMEAQKKLLRTSRLFLKDKENAVARKAEVDAMQFSVSV